MKVYVDFENLDFEDNPNNRKTYGYSLTAKSFERRKEYGVNLVSLSDHDKQVRKELVKEIKQKILNTTSYETEEELHSYIYDLNAGAVLDILDQIQGE